MPAGTVAEFGSGETRTSGAGSTIRATMASTGARVEVVWIVKFAVPTVADRAVAIVKTLEVEPVGIDVGLKVAVAPVGSPLLTLNPTAPVKPLKRATFTL